MRGWAPAIAALDDIALAAFELQVELPDLPALQGIGNRLEPLVIEPDNVALIGEIDEH